MAAPNSNGVLRTKLADMKIGDYIKWGYSAFSANVAGTLQEDTTGMTELSSTAAASSGDGGYFYFIKWRQGLLIADRAIQSSISAQSLNKVGYYEGSKYRLLTEAEFNSAMDDDFGGNFKFSANPGSTFVAANNINKCAGGTNSLVNVVLLFQASFAQRYFGWVYVPDCSYDSKKCSFASPSVVAARSAVSQATLIYTFLPCMEYVDNSKSTNIFY